MRTHARADAAVRMINIRMGSPRASARISERRTMA
jgi:hypothetical protein